MNPRVSTAIVIVALVVMYGVVLLQTRPSQQAIDANLKAAPVESLSSEAFSASFFAQLRSRDVNGELPVSVTPGDTYAGQSRNPFTNP